jgi:hypothetical protein
VWVVWTVYGNGKRGSQVARFIHLISNSISSFVRRPSLEAKTMIQKASHAFSHYCTGNNLLW